MSCTNYVHNDPIGGSKFISGTTCTGSVAYYTLTLGQEVCMDNSKPLINLNGLVISGDCTGVTPTPTPTPINYCYLSGFTYQSAIFQCPNDGLDYFDTYGVWTFSAYTGSQFTNDHPQLSFTLTNGTDYAVVTIESNQYFTEFIYPKIDFRYTDTGCVSTTYPDWYVYTPATTQCFLTPTPSITPTQTKTPTQTPTISLTPTITPTQNQICPEQIVVSNATNALYNGTYNRLYSWTGGTFDDGWYRAETIRCFNDGQLNGISYPVYGRFDGTSYFTLIAQSFALPSTDFRLWSIIQDNTYYIPNKPCGLATSGSLGLSLSSETSSGYSYPARGQQASGYISYPSVCPTTTPTPTVTSTPTITPTNTITPSITPTTTQTPTITPSITPTQTKVSFGGTYYSASTYCDACNNVNGNFVTLYTTGATLCDDTVEFVYLDSNLTLPAGPGAIAWTGLCANPNTLASGELLSSGEIDDYILCGICFTPTPTRTPTMTPTPTKTTTPTVTPSITPTITPSISYYSYVVGFNATSGCSACNQFTGGTTITVYGPLSNGPTLNLGEILYSDTSLTTPVVDGYYATDSTSTPPDWFRVDSTFGPPFIPGQITQRAECSSC